MNEIRGASRFEFVPSFLEVLSGVRFGKFLAGKDHEHIAAFISQRHSVRGGALWRYPPGVNPFRLIRPRAYRVEALVTKRFHHLPKFLLRPRRAGAGLYSLQFLA